ncbi:MAG: FtsW/RodA/SpoVE family cell cycle protein [Lachnospiraceae bacterium]|nr:FtsW/RodA/SpoVE family cell cycle protein [Lachnospiraceae bacterium]
MLKKYSLKRYNFRLLIFVLLLASIGVVVIGSATGLATYEKKQVMGIAVGLVGMLIISLVDYNLILKFYWVIYLINIVLLVLVKIPGVGKEVNGATRWIEIVEDTISIQPSEFAKVFIILFLAKHLGANKDKINTFKFLAITAILVLIPLGLIAIEPDLSTTILTIGIILIILYVSKLSYKIIAGALLVCVPIAAGLIIYIQQPNQKLLKDYQVQRIMAFVEPDKYDNGRYQQEYSLLAIGSGQLNGKGLYNDDVSSVKNGNFISEPQTDFIFAVVGEELGFIGGCTILILLVLIVLECIITAIRANDLTGRLIAIGIGAMITLQTFINIGVATKLLPNTGVPLPFVSYGLSSLLSMFGSMGFIINIGLHERK